MIAAVKVGRQRKIRPRRGQAKIGLILAAAELARENGLHGLTVDAIVNRTGVSKGAFFHHFSTRQEIVAALLNHLAKTFESDLAEREAANQSFTQSLIEATLSEVQRDTGFMATLVTAIALDRELGRIVEARTEAWTRRMIQEGLAEPEARLVRSALDGLLLQCLLARGSSLNKKRISAVRKALAKVLVR